MPAWNLLAARRIQALPVEMSSVAFCAGRIDVGHGRVVELFCSRKLLIHFPRRALQISFVPSTAHAAFGTFGEYRASGFRLCTSGVR